MAFGRPERVDALAEHGQFSLEVRGSARCGARGARGGSAGCAARVLVRLLEAAPPRGGAGAVLGEGAVEGRLEDAAEETAIHAERRQEDPRVPSCSTVGEGGSAVAG